MDLPRPAGPTSGMRCTFSQYIRPRVVKIRMYACVDAMKTWVRKSSSRVRIPSRPLPPRRWLRYCVTAVRLMYPVLLTVMATSSSAIRSSMLKSPSASMISVRRSSPYDSRTSRSSSTTISISSASLCRMARSRSIVRCRSANSSSTFCRSSPVRRLQLHVENGLRLNLAERKIGDQAEAGLRRRL